MPQAKTTPTIEEIRAMQVTAALDEAVRINEEYEGYITRRKANREELRNLVAQGHVKDPEDRALIEELYAERKATRKTDEERAAELEAQAQKVRERAAKKAEKEAAQTTPEPEATPEPAPAAA